MAEIETHQEVHVPTELFSLISYYHRSHLCHYPRSQPSDAGALLKLPTIDVHVYYTAISSVACKVVQGTFVIGFIKHSYKLHFATQRSMPYHNHSSDSDFISTAAQCTHKLQQDM